MRQLTCAALRAAVKAIAVIEALSLVFSGWISYKWHRYQKRRRGR